MQPARVSFIARTLQRARFRFGAAFFAGWLLALAACTPEAPPVVTNIRPALPTPREMLAQVHAAGNEHPEALEVEPLRDPQVADLRAQAGTLEAQADYAGAAQAIAHAMTITPGDPDLLQQAAEIALYQQDWSHAGTFARQSYDKGPKVGSLCRRNWATLRLVRLASGDEPGVQDALRQLATCNVEPPVRM